MNEKKKNDYNNNKIDEFVKNKKRLVEQLWHIIVTFFFIERQTQYSLSVNKFFRSLL